jgi:hypothetical protein
MAEVFPFREIKRPNWECKLSRGVLENHGMSGLGISRTQQGDQELERKASRCAGRPQNAPECDAAQEYLDNPDSDE